MFVWKLLHRTCKPPQGNKDPIQHWPTPERSLTLTTMFVWQKFTEHVPTQQWTKLHRPATLPSIMCVLKPPLWACKPPKASRTTNTPTSPQHNDTRAAKEFCWGWLGCPSTLAETAAAKIWLCYKEKGNHAIHRHAAARASCRRAAFKLLDTKMVSQWKNNKFKFTITGLSHGLPYSFWSLVMSVGGVLFLSCLLCWWSFLSVRRVVLKVGCVLTGFAPARARKRKRWWLGSRAREPRQMLLLYRWCW